MSTDSENDDDFYGDLNDSSFTTEISSSLPSTIMNESTEKPSQIKRCDQWHDDIGGHGNYSASTLSQNLDNEGIYFAEDEFSDIVTTTASSFTLGNDSEIEESFRIGTNIKEILTTKTTSPQISKAQKSLESVTPKISSQEINYFNRVCI